MAPWHAWKYREGRATRYLGKRVGGTVVVHFIKKNMWFLETAMAMLEGEDVTENERITGLLAVPGAGSSGAGQVVAAPPSSDQSPAAMRNPSRRALR